MNDLILALGSNQGDKAGFLNRADSLLRKHFKLIEKSPVYLSDPVDVLDQPAFFNQVNHYQTEIEDPYEVLAITQSIEDQIGRDKFIEKGPRNIDIDIIFHGETRAQSENLVIPHQSWDQRSFVVLPLLDLKYSENRPFLRKNMKFSATAYPI